MDSDIAGEATFVANDPLALEPIGEPAGSSGNLAEKPGRNSIFGQLVRSDTDIDGLVAYSIYKQNKLDWLAAFEAAGKRAPNEAELSSYIIGESTPRRLATYRHLAEATLAGQGPTNGQSVSHGPNVGGHNVGKPILTRRSIAIAMILAILAILAILFLLGYWLAAHVTLAGH